MPRRSGRGGGPLRRAPLRQAPRESESRQPPLPLLPPPSPRFNRSRTIGTRYVRTRTIRTRSWRPTLTLNHVEGTPAAKAQVSDLVERLDGPHRTINDLLQHYSSAPLQEWRLTVGIRQLLQLLQNDSALDAAERLLWFLVKNDDDSAIRVLWLTDTHYVVADRRKYCFVRNVPDLPAEDGVAPRILASYDLSLKELDRYHSPTLGVVMEGRNPEPRVLQALNRLVGLSANVTFAFLDVDGVIFPEMIPGIADFVSLARSRRTVAVNCHVSSETGRALAYNCSPLVSLCVNLRNWNDQGAAIAEAMVANRCYRIGLEGIPDASVPSLAAAIAATSSLVGLGLEIRSLSRDTAIFDAIGRNQSIRSLNVWTTEPLAEASTANEPERFWLSILKSSSIQAISTRPRYLYPYTLDDTVRRECAELVAMHIRKNTRITELDCNPRTHDEEIMGSRVAPVVRWNRFLPIVAGLSDSSGDGEDRENRVAAVLVAPRVRRHPELMYHLLRENWVQLLPS